MKKCYKFLMVLAAGVFVTFSANAQYCNPNTSSSWGSNQEVKTTGGVVNISKNTGTSNNSVNDFTATDSCSYGLGTTASVELKHSYSAGLWIDWNNDQDFNDPGEAIFVPSSYNGGSTITETHTFTVPNTAATGSLRMRVLQGYYWQMQPCGYSSYTGDVEDYTFHVIPPVPNDAAATELSPSTLCTGLQPLNVRVVNMGSDTLKQVRVHGVVGTTTFTPITLTGLLLPRLADTLVTIGSYNFTPSTVVNMDFWTSLPNNVTDQNTVNDSIGFLNFKASLSGTYTVGTAGDFGTIKAAIDALEANGVCGPVILNLKEETFDEQVQIDAIPGVSMVNDVTIQSDPTNTNNSVWEYNSSSANNYVCSFNNSAHVSIKNITMISKNGSYGRVVDMRGYNHHITLDNDSLETRTTTSTSTNMAMVYDWTGGANKAEDITITNCDFTNGSYGIYAYGVSSSNHQFRWTIENNTFMDFVYRGVYAYYGEEYEINYNVMKGKGTYCCGPSGVYCYYNYKTNVIGNDIEVAGTSYSYPLYYYRCYGTSSDRYLVANNMVKATRATATGSVYGIYSYYANYVDVSHNSVYVAGGNGSSTRGIYSYYGTSTTLQNNAVRNDGNGHAFYILGSKTRTNNAGFAPNGTGHWNTSLGTNSVVADPDFVSTTDLHAKSPALHNAGANLTALIDDDFDGDIRCPLAGCTGSGLAPDIGADEFWLPDYDAGVSELASAAPCPGNQTVMVKVKNYGAKTLTSFKVDWTINGVGQTQLVVPSSAIAPGNDTTVTLGSHMFTLGVADNFMFYTSDPSGQTDQKNSNDSLPEMIQPAMSGIFTIGSNGDYTSVDSAVMDLKNLGVCGPLTFHLDDSVWVGDVDYGSINGVSAVNTVRFTSDPNNTQMGEIEGKISFENAEYVRFDHLIVTNTGYGFHLKGNCNNIMIDSNDINIPKSTSNATAGIYDDNGSNCKDIDIIGNDISGSYWAIRFYGGGSGRNARDEGVNISGNTMTDYSQYGLYAYYQLDMHVDDNIMRNDPGVYYSPYGINIRYSNNHTLRRNHITINSGGGGYGIYDYYGNYYNRQSADSNLTYANSVANVNDQNAGTQYGIYMYRGYNYKFIHNTIRNSSSSNFSRALYTYYMYNSAFYNNFISNERGAYTWYHNRTWSNCTNDYNAFWTGNIANNGTFGITVGTNSVNATPRFKDEANGDLRPNSLELDSAGMAGTGVSMDNRSGMYDATHPDIGAHSFVPCFFDGAMRDLSHGYAGIPAGQSVRLNATVASAGLDTITGVTVNFDVNGNTSSTPIGMMLIDSDTTINTVAALGTTVGVYQARASVAINESDCDAENDTIYTSINITDTVYQREDDTASTNGIGNPTPLEFGQTFEVFTADTLTSVDFWLTTPTVGATVRVLIYNTDSAGAPDQLMDSTRAEMVQVNTGMWYTQKVGCEGIILQPGVYFVSVHQVNPVNMSLGYNTSRNGSARYIYVDLYDGNGWRRSDDAGLNPIVDNMTFLLRANFGRWGAPDVLEPTTTICNGGTAEIVPNQKYQSQIWSNGLFFPTLTVATAGTYGVTVWDDIGCKYSDSTIASVTQPIVLTANPTAASCGMSDGSATAAASGTSAPYTYEWSNGMTGDAVSGLAGDDYQVTVTDSVGCTEVLDVQVLGAYPTISNSWTHPTCNGDANGTATSTVDAGVMPYTYSWNAGGTPNASTNVGLIAGTYYVSVTDASGCTSIDTVDVMQTPVINVGMGAASPSACKMADGSATASITGGMAPYQYFWSDPNSQSTSKAVGLGEGTYDVTITDALGCVKTGKVTVVDPNSPVISTADQNLNCSYDTTSIVTMFTGGTAPFTYSWDYMNAQTADLNGVGPGKYKLHMVDAAGCDDDAVITISAPDPVTITFTNIVDNGQNKVEATASAVGGTTPYQSYTWSNGDTTATSTRLANGVNTVTVVDDNGCTFSAQIDIFSEYTGINNLLATGAFQIYPNPTTGLVNIELNLNGAENVSVRVLTSLGEVVEVVERGEVAQDNISIDLTNLAVGMYYVETTIGSEQVISKIQLSR
ncbi:right-handed parallel beta-helix repeat-containing protein [bacterium SCSIO 12741]|nr:right-handed parallel beta-helix repeat-containing protein [bacterium SCSIO 12741]